MHINSKNPFAILIMIEFHKIKWSVFQVIRTGQAFHYQSLNILIISNRDFRDFCLCFQVIHLHEWFSDSISMERHTEGIMRLQQPVPRLN